MSRLRPPPGSLGSHRMRSSCANGSRRIPRIAAARRAGCAKSNRTDNGSAKLATDKGVSQGYTGVAAVDGKHQIIVEAQAHGTGSEQELLLPVVEALATMRTSATILTLTRDTIVKRISPRSRRCTCQR